MVVRRVGGAAVVALVFAAMAGRAEAAPCGNTSAGFENWKRAFAQEAGASGVGPKAISALMTTTMPAMKRTIDALLKAGLREHVKVMVGGAPVSQAFADEIGADGYARDSTLAVVKAKTLLGVAVSR